MRLPPFTFFFYVVRNEFAPLDQPFPPFSLRLFTQTGKMFVITDTFPIYNAVSDRDPYMRVTVARLTHHGFTLPTSPAILPCMRSDVPPTLDHFNGLDFDDDCELFLHLGLMGFLASFIWFMNSKWTWRELFTIFCSLLMVLSEGFLPNYS